MSLTVQHKENVFGVGDRIKVFQKVKEGDKFRLQAFEGRVIAIKGRQSEKTITVRRIGAHKIGIERIFPLSSPLYEKIEVVRKGLSGVRHAKLYYTRGQSHRDIEKIYARAARRDAKAATVVKSKARKAKPKAKKVKAKIKKTSKKTST